MNHPVWTLASIGHTFYIGTLDYSRLFEQVPSWWQKWSKGNHFLLWMYQIRDLQSVYRAEVHDWSGQGRVLYLFCEAWAGQIKEDVCLFQKYCETLQFSHAKMFIGIFVIFQSNALRFEWEFFVNKIIHGHNKIYSFHQMQRNQMIRAVKLC